MEKHNNKMQQQMNTNLDSTNIWYETLAELDAWMTENGREPSARNESPLEQLLDAWKYIQNEKYENGQWSTTNPEKRRAWEEHISRHREFYDDKWYMTLGELNAWITKNDKRPVPKTEDPVEERLWQWEYNQIVNRKNPEKKRAWDIHVATFQQYYGTDQWYRNLGELNAWMSKNGLRPSAQNRDQVENRLGKWFSNQNYLFNQGATGLMSEPERRRAWEEHLAKFSKCYNTETFQEPHQPQEECVAPKKELVTAKEARQRSDVCEEQLWGVDEQFINKAITDAYSKGKRTVHIQFGTLESDMGLVESKLKSAGFKVFYGSNCIIIDWW